MGPGKSLEEPRSRGFKITPGERVRQGLTRVFENLFDFYRKVRIEGDSELLGFCEDGLGPDGAFKDQASGFIIHIHSGGIIGRD